MIKPTINNLRDAILQCPWVVLWHGAMIFQACLRAFGGGRWRAIARPRSKSGVVRLLTRMDEDEELPRVGLAGKGD
ncbi:hypothetical protein AK812_SmicGene9010 [Symbiodinium microadriaticum]|uniref:Uncharacterized protein n=1 Tax=Symbiodinium microadriaticum TaxID=2951 RepID=A0A1Q9EJM5_SYMMI|nr:hypothetical protein AK812_SmicGene9010 [Symbiodinium microadriaticum]